MWRFLNQFKFIHMLHTVCYMIVFDFKQKRLKSSSVNYSASANWSVTDPVKTCHHSFCCCSGCIAFRCVCLSLCWLLFRQTFTGILYGETTNVYMLIILLDGFECLARCEKKHKIPCNRCRLVIKAKRTYCCPSDPLCECLCVFLRVQSVHQWWTTYCEKKGGGEWDSLTAGKTGWVLLYWFLFSSVLQCTLCSVVIGHGRPGWNNLSSSERSGTWAKCREHV